MQSKVSVIGTGARDRAFKGATYVVNGVKSTLGPFGMNALIEKGNKSTNDGFLISGELLGTIENEFERLGAHVVHEAASKTNDEVGDATTTVQTLWHAITQAAIRLLPNEKSIIGKKKPIEVTYMIQESKDNVIKMLESAAVPILTEAELIASAKVSVEDEELAKLIGSAQWQIGPRGHIIVEETVKPDSSIEYVKGLYLDNGFGTSIMVTNQEKQTLEIIEASVILTNHVIQESDLKELTKTIFKPLMGTKQNTIAIVARGFSSEAIKYCAEQHKLGLYLFPINAPYTNQAEVMKDLAAVLGGKYIDNEQTALLDINVSDLGFASSIIASRSTATIAGDETEHVQASTLKRVDELQQKLKGEISEFERKHIEGRIAQLEKGFAILKVGAHSVIDRKRIKDKCDDAVSSVRLALQGGTVKGAGLAFKEIADKLDANDILKGPLASIHDEIMGSAPEGFVIEDWVRDPFLTLKAALTNACASVATFAMTNIVIASKNPEKACHANVAPAAEEE